MWVFSLPLRLRPQKDAVCGAVTSRSEGNQSLRQRVLGPVCAELHSVPQGHKHARLGCVSVPGSCREHSRDAIKEMSLMCGAAAGAGGEAAGSRGWGADAPAAMIPLTALLLRCQSALGECICCFVPVPIC